MNLKNNFTALMLAINFLSLFPLPAQSREIMYADSILCKNQNLDTYMAFGTLDFNVVICFRGNDCVYESENNEYLYIIQDKTNNKKMTLPAEYSILDGLDWTERWDAFDGSILHQVTQANHKDGGYAFISIFNNSETIYTSRATRYIYNCSD